MRFSHVYRRVLLMAVTLSYVGIATLQADTISNPVSVAIPDRINGVLSNKPVSVAFPSALYGKMDSKPVSVFLPKPVDGYLYSRAVSVSVPVPTNGFFISRPASVSRQMENLGDTDLVGLWHMDGDWGDSSGNNLHAAPINGAALVGDHKLGSQAGGFDGYDDHARIGNLYGRFPNNTITIEAWIKADSTAGGARRTIAGGVGQWADYSIGIANNHLVAFVAGGTNVYSLADSGVTPNIGEWYHLAGVYDGMRLKVFVNGSLKNEIPALWRQVNGGVDFWIGGEHCCGQYFDGLIDEVAIYKRALTAEEIAVHYAAGINDPAAPTPPTVDPLPAYVGSSTTNLSGTRTPNTSIWVNNKKVSPIENTSSWQGTYGTLQPGTNILNITAVDAAYRQSQPVTRTVFYDNLPPVIESSIPANGFNTARVISSVAISLFDANAGVDLAGSTQNATVRNAAGQTVAGTWTTSGAKTIVFTPSNPFPQDTYTVAIYPVDAVGNRTTQPLQITFTNHDISQPVTKISLSGAKDGAGWYSIPVTVTLTADDGTEGAGIDRIEYSLDNVTWQLYSAPFAVEKDGNNNLYFRAIDKAGNSETPTKSQEIKINKTGLVGLWHMDGDWKDSSVVGNNGTPYNGATFNANAKIGTQSGGFDGVNDYVEIPNNATLNPAKISVELWAKSNTATWNNYGFLASKRDAYILHPVQGSKDIRFYVFVDGAWQSVTFSNPNLDITQWHHYVGTFDGTTLNIYVDGIKNSVQYAGSINTTDTGSLYLGWDDGQSGRYFNGLIDEVAIYNRALSATEIQEHYRNYTIGVPTVEPVVSPTNAPTITLRGTKPADTAVVVSGATIVPRDAATTWEGNYTLVRGMNNLSVTAMDADGFHSQPVTLSVALDQTAPAVAATNPLNGGLFNNDITSLSLTFTDAFSAIDDAATLAGAMVKTASGLNVSGTWGATGSGTTRTFVFAPSLAMSEGSYTATITPTDTFGNTATATLSFTVDVTPPSPPTIDTQSAPIRFTSKTVTGTKTADASRVMVTCPGASVAALTYPTATTWSATVTNLKEGNNTVTAYAEDAAGNQSGSVSAVITLDLTPPAKPTIAAYASPTKETTVTLTGAKEANTWLFVNNQQIDAPFSGTAWSRSVSLGEGSNTFTLFAKDEAGNQGQSASVTVVRDTTAPAVASSLPVNNAVTASADLVSVTFSDAAAGVDLQGSTAGAVVKNAAGAVVAGSWSVSGSAIVFTPAALIPEGVYSVTLYPVDTLGNKGSASFSFTLDRAPPAIQGVVMNPTSPHKAETVTFTVTFSEAMDRSVTPSLTIVKPGVILDTTYILNGGWSSDTSWQGSFAFTANTGDGLWDIRVANAKDRAGNPMNSYEQKGAFVLDTTPPDKPSLNAVTTPTKTATQTLTGAKPADTALVINGTERVPLNSTTTWSYNYPLNEAANTLTIVARDAAGNDSAPITPVPVITLDTTPPLFAVDTYKNPSTTATQTISGRKEAGCVVKLNGATIFDAADQSATWSYLLNLTEGITNHLIFTAADALGNTTTKTIDILYDAAAPAALGAGMLVANGSGKGTEVTLSWPSYVEPADLAYYRVYYAPADFTAISSLTPVGTVNKGTRTYKVTGLTQGTTYFFAIVPVDASGNFDPAVHTASVAPADTVAPEEVTGLAAWAGYIAGDGNYVTLSWTGSANSAGDLADQVIYVDAGQGYDAGTPIGKTAATFTKKGLADATLYKFKVTTKDTGGHESAGVVVTAATRLANPTGLAAVPGNSKVTLTWNGVSSPYVKLYNVYRLQFAVQQTDVAAMTLVKSQTGTSFTDTGLTNGATYQYAVTTVNSSGAERTGVQSIAAAPRGDIVGPVIGSLNLTANQVITAPATITASATDSESAVAKLEIYIDGTLAKSQTGSAISFAWDVVQAADGNHTVKIVAYDAPGNTTESIVPVVVSLAPPAAPVITTTFGGPTTQKSVTISGTTQPGSTVYLRVNGVVLSQMVSSTSTFTFTSVSLVEGDNLVAAKAANRGGESAYSADLRIIVDSGAPVAPTALTAKPLAGGSVQLTWQAGTGETPTGYNLYESTQSFTAKTDAGVRKTNSAAITYLLKEYIPADDTPRFYAVTALDGAGNESPISNVVQTASDRLSPSAASVTFSDASGATPTDNIYGPGSVTVRLTVSEPLKELPFFSLEPASGSPIVVALKKITPSPPVGEGGGEGETYTGSVTLDATSPSGPTTWKFSGKDLIGNRGNGSGTGPTIDVKGPAATITAPVTLLKTTAGPVPVAVTFDEPSVTTPALELRSGSVVAQVAGLLSTDSGLHWTGTVDPAALAEGTGQFVLTSAQDRFGNRGTTVKSGASILLYKDSPPAPTVPEGLTAKSVKGGAVALSWGRFGDAGKYRVYRRGEGETVPVAVADVAGTQASYSDTPPADGTWRYSISALGLLDSESARGEEVAGVSDRSGPPVPTGLNLVLTGNGVQAAWDAPAAGVEVPNAYRFYRSDAPFTSINGLTSLITIKTSPAVDTAPTSSKRFYAVTSLDILGNESAPSATVEITFPVAPVKNLALTLVDDGKPSLSWEAGEGNLQGFYIYRNGNKINQVPTPSTSYSDGYYSGSTVTYGVSAINYLGTESPIKEVTLPPLTIGLKEGTTLRRGLLENVPVVASLPAQNSLPSPPAGEGQGEGVTIDAIALKIGPLPESTESGPFTVSAAAPLEVQKVAATEATAPPQEAVVVSAVMNPSPGTTVKITRSSVASVLGSGTALEIFNEPLVRGTVGKARIKVNNLGSAQMSFLTSENNGPTGQVKVYLKDQDGNILAQGSLNQRVGAAVVNSGSYATARLNPGETFLSDPITFAVPATAPYKVVIEAQIQNTYYHYNQPDQVIAPGLKQSIEATISEVPYMAQVQVDKATYKQGETVTITGQALSTADGTPVTNVPVKIGVSVGGFDRYFTATTDQNGNLAYVFTPGSSETGTYSVWAMHPDLSDRTVQAQFSIIGMSVSPKLINVTTTRNKPVDVTITIKNLSGSPLSGFTITPSSSSGIDATVVNAGSNVLNGGETRNVTFHIAPQSTAPNSGYASLSIATAEGLTDKVEANVTLVNAIPVISTSPSYIDTGLTRGTQKIVTLTVRNTGIETLRNARIEGPSLPWMSLTIDKNLGDIGANQSKEVGILLKPSDTLAQGIYNDRIVIYSDNHIPYSYNIQVTVTSNAVGNVQFSVLDEIMRDVANASITIQHQSVLDLMYTLRTGSDGAASLFDIPEGRYTYNISVSGAKPYSGSFTIEPGVTTTVPVALELTLVQIEWSVTPTVIQDQYQITISQTFETNVPAPVLVTEPPNVTLPELQPGQVFNGEFTVTNYGLIAVDNVAIDFPRSFDDYDVEILATAIPTRLNAMQKITVPYRITRRQAVAFNYGNYFAAFFEEVKSYGGSSCYKSVPLFTVHGTAIICPNTPQQRTVDRSTTHYGQVPYACSTGSGSPSTYTPTATVGSGSGYSQSTGSGGPGISTPLPTTNPCDCKPDGTVLTDTNSGDCMRPECRGGNPLNAINDNDKPSNICKDCMSGNVFNVANGRSLRDSHSCCYEGEVQQNYPIVDVDKCPNRVRITGYNPWDHVNGCGGSGGTQVPDNPMYTLHQGDFNYLFRHDPNDGNFLDPCNAHDACYGSCNTPKSECDSAFGSRMDSICYNDFGSDIRDAIYLTECLALSLTYEGFVSSPLGITYYNDGQKQACKCCYN